MQNIPLRSDLQLKENVKRHCTHLFCHVIVILVIF